jgi:pantoate--beta-alanine ligase
MGALHAGHRSLIRAARLRCDALVVSIFVNPTQFGPHEDLARYPRPIAKDRALCRAEGVDVCFEPPVEAMYPEGFQTMVTMRKLPRRWEGVARPHHFDGVATVVAKLFGIVRPHRAVFGQKDYQQAALVRQLIADLNLGIRLDIRPTVREQDSLAMSSRNAYLSVEARQIAPILYQALQAGKQAIEGGTADARSVVNRMRTVLGREPAARVDYVAVCDLKTLEPLAVIEHDAVLLGAIRLGAVRLIDNVIVRTGKRTR